MLILNDIVSLVMLITAYQLASICILALLGILILFKYVLKRRVKQDLLEELGRSEGLPDDVPDVEQAGVEKPGQAITKNTPSPHDV